MTVWLGGFVPLPALFLVGSPIIEPDDPLRSGLQFVGDSIKPAVGVGRRRPRAWTGRRAFNVRVSGVRIALCGGGRTLISMVPCSCQATYEGRIASGWPPPRSFFVCEGYQRTRPQAAGRHGTASYALRLLDRRRLFDRPGMKGFDDLLEAVVIPARRLDVRDQAASRPEQDVWRSRSLAARPTGGHQAGSGA